MSSLETMEDFMASLKVREENYCFSHALQAAAAYYRAALPESVDAVLQMRRIRAEGAAPRTPPPSRTRVQPPRGVKKTPSYTGQQARASAERRVRALAAAMPVPVGEDGFVLGEEAWLEAVRVAVEEVTTRKVLERYREGPRPCVFGGRGWRCGRCEEEFREAHPGVAWGGDWGEPEAVMEGAVEGKLVEGRGWWDVEIPEREVARVGGLRFVVDVCDADNALVMFV